ncbi:MAG TPA: DNA-processing protein DprA, partial [Candidatus Limnocylindrales bacterium]
MAAPPSEREAWALLLSIEGLGPAGFGGLVATFGSGRAILAAAARPGASRAIARAVAAGQGRPVGDADLGERIGRMARDPGAALAILRAAAVDILTLDDRGYPARLRSIAQPPPVLLLRGDVPALSAPRTIAIVGTRRPTEGGRLIAARIAAAISRVGGVVVSGLAVGIDGAAHAAATDERRPTIAVLGSGHERLYPRAHRRLARDIVATGGIVVSERFPDGPPTRGSFPQRNRLISGLADVTIVVEAGLQSGALITARWALGQGRECYVVPGPMDEPRSAGCLALYRDYPALVRLVTGIPELLADLGLDRDATPSPNGPPRPSLEARLVELGPTARDVAAALVAGNGTLDDLVGATGHESATVLGTITLLEMAGLATSTYGRYRAAGGLASSADRLRRAPRASGRPRRGTVPAAGSRGPPELPSRTSPCYGAGHWPHAHPAADSPETVSRPPANRAGDCRIAQSCRRGSGRPVRRD